MLNSYPKKNFDFLNGEVLLINKPSGWTSFDVVNKIRYMLKYHMGIKKIKVGHAGTLDPLATGLLIICTGLFTKKIDEFQQLDKEYSGTFLIGATTPSHDSETEVDNTYPIDHITRELLQQTVQKFTGTINQIPPVYSAVKIKGTRAYRLARKNEEIRMTPRTVTINEFELTRINLPEVDVRVSCSKGTYIRSLARDFGEALGCGAYLSALCRTKIGNYKLSDALEIDELEKIITSDQ
jgi:tRNA pseudouridine55 synthase